MNTKPSIQSVPENPVIKWGHNTKLVNINWLWKPFIPFGKVTLIEGDGGDGKTTMILTIAAMMSKGTQPPTMEHGKLFPSEICKPITTFYLTNEDEVADTSLKRFIRAGGDSHRFAYSAELQHHMTLKKNELISAIRQSGCRLFIIDPVQAFLPEGANLGSVTKMRPIFTMLANIAKTTGVAIVLVGHLNKNESSKDIHRGFGSADIAAAVRSILMVEMDKNDRKKRWVRAIKSNFDESDYARIRLIMDDERKLSFAEFEDEKIETQPAGTKIEIASAILQEILKDSPMPVSEINQFMAEEGIGPKTAQRAKVRIGAVQEYRNGIPVWRLQ